MLSRAVQKALQHQKPVVSLESTIITHGMPYPENYETTMELINIVEENGCTPAPIAIINGQVKIGLDKDELHQLAKMGPSVRKCSLRDIPQVVAQKGFGATTVSSTLYFSAMNGIPVFATGGIGGVHRNGQQTFDISADLTELGSRLVGQEHGVAVVCAGAKSVLDIGLTLEYLETQGVPVFSYQQSQFPAFYTADSGYESPQQIRSMDEAVETLAQHRSLGIKKGMVLACPIPKSSGDDDDQIIEQSIQQALSELGNIKGRDVTPYLLKRISELSQGASLRANIRLVKNNTDIGSKLAYNLMLKK